MSFVSIIFDYFYKQNKAHWNYKYMWICSLKNKVITIVLLMMKVLGNSALATLSVFGLMVVGGDALVSADFFTNL